MLVFKPRICRAALQSCVSMIRLICWHAYYLAMVMRVNLAGSGLGNGAIIVTLCHHFAALKCFEI